MAWRAASEVLRWGGRFQFLHPPTPTLPHKGGGGQKLPPPLWGRVGVGGRGNNFRPLGCQLASRGRRRYGGNFGRGSRCPGWVRRGGAQAIASSLCATTLRATIR